MTASTFYVISTIFAGISLVIALISLANGRKDK